MSRVDDKEGDTYTATLSNGIDASKSGTKGAVSHYVGAEGILESTMLICYTTVLVGFAGRRPLRPLSVIL